MESDSDVEGYELFFRDVEPMLRRVAFLYTDDSAQAHDLVQETLVRAWQHWSKVSRHPHPEAWCRTVLRNLAASRGRRVRIERAHRDERATSSAGPSAEHLDVVRAIDRLPDHQRQALVLHHVVGLTAEEIASELRTKPGTVRSWLSRGRQSLARELADRLPQDIEKGGR